MHTGNRSPMSTFIFSPATKNPVFGWLFLRVMSDDIWPWKIWWRKLHEKPTTCFILNGWNSSSPGNRINVLPGDSNFFLHLGFEHPPSPQKILTQKILSLRNPGWVTPGSLPGDSGSHRKRQVDCLVRCGYTSLEFWHQVGRFYHSRLWPDTWWSDFGCQIVKHLGGLVIPYLAILR